MTTYQKIGLALAEARSRSGIDQPSLDRYLLTHLPGYVSGSLSDWERGIALPSSEAVLSILHICRSNIYLFMLNCGLEEMQPLIDP